MGHQHHWEVFDVIIGGRSVVDSKAGLTGVPIPDAEAAENFLKSYGYDIHDPIEAAEAVGHVQEAISFVRRYFLKPENPEGLDQEIPRKILELSDLRDLLLMASMTFPGQSMDPPGQQLQRWACALLKVVHTLAHIDKDIRSLYFSDIQKTIFDRFYRHIQRDGDGKLYLGERPDDPRRVPLVAFETKPRKARDSVLIKLLHKPEYVADEIFDQVGIRIITESVLDTLRVIKFLKDQTVLMPANIKPSRSRNTLLNLEAIRDDLDRIFSGPLPPDEAERLRRKAQIELHGDGVNPHTSEYYRAIQFTCRQLVKFRNPNYEAIRDLKNSSKSGGVPDEILAKLERIDFKYLHREVKFFYPYEVQVVDRASQIENERGRSAHSEYKRAQVQAALKRVMGGLLE